MKERILEMITDELLEVDGELGTDGDLFEAGLDSMAIMQLLLLLEEEFGTEIPVGEVSRENFSTAESIARLVEERKSAASS